jgi:hypothetical protein
MLWTIFNQHKLKISATYLLFLIEFVLFAMLPYILGEAVDALMAGEHQTLAIYVGISLFGMVLGWFRRRLDTRVFMKLWATYTNESVGNLIRRGIESTKIISRSQHTYTYINFIDVGLPSFTSSAVNIVISCVMIFMASWIAGIAAIVIAGVTLVSCYLYSIKIQETELEGQTIREDLHAAIVDTDVDKVQDCYDRSLKNEVRHSDLMAASWGILDTLSLMATTVILVSVIKSGHSIGIITSTLTYTTRLFERAEIVGYFFNSLKGVEIADHVLAKEN